jgi:hypothetical protein
MDDETADSYLGGTLIEQLQHKAGKMLKPLHHLHPEEAAVLVLLTRRLGEESKKNKYRYRVFPKARVAVSIPFVHGRGARATEKSRAAR